MSEVTETTNEAPEEVVDSTEEVPEEVEESTEGAESTSEDDEQIDIEEVPEEETEEPEQKDEPQNFKEIFKAHPELRKAYFEANQYRTVFPTVEDAQEAYDRVQTFEDFETSIREGDVNPVIQSIIDSNPQAFATFAENFLPNLQQMDPRLFDKAFAPTVSNLLRSAMQAGHKNGNKNLLLAAQHLSNWIFGDAAPPELKPAPQVVRQNGDIQGRSQEFFKELGDEVSVFLNSESLRNLDPNNVLPAPLKKLAAQDIISEAVKILKGNAQAQRQLQILREKAARSGFSYESRKALRDSYQTMMRPIIARLKGPKRDEMMKTIGKDAVGNKVQKKTVPAAPGTGRKVAIDPKKIDTSRTSMLDVLNGNVKMKGEK